MINYNLSDRDDSEIWKAYRKQCAEQYIDYRDFIQSQLPDAFVDRVPNQGILITFSSEEDLNAYLLRWG